jgi:hypothetical protein
MFNDAASNVARQSVDSITPLHLQIRAGCVVGRGKHLPEGHAKRLSLIALSTRMIELSSLKE